MDVYEDFNYRFETKGYEVFVGRKPVKHNPIDNEVEKLRKENEELKKKFADLLEKQNLIDLIEKLN
jgi:hypothetical protein